MDLINRLIMPFRLKKIRAYFEKRPFKLLDVGCGDISPVQTKKFFPNCDYHGLDREFHKDTLNDGTFYSVDLEKDTLEQIPNEHFDAVVMSHVLEHLTRPTEVLERVCSKVKKGGVIYLEFPSLTSLGLPSMHGTMQFCDDQTHTFLPNPYEIANLLLNQKMRILSAKIRRDRFRLFCSPIFIGLNLMRRLLGKKVKSKGLWDLKGFAYFVWAVKI